MKLEPEQLILSALKKCEARDSIIVRFFNPTERELHGKLSFWEPIKLAWLTNLNEEQQKKLDVSKNGTLEIKVGHKKIMTVELTF